MCVTSNFMLSHKGIRQKSFASPRLMTFAKEYSFLHSPGPRFSSSFCSTLFAQRIFMRPVQAGRERGAGKLLSA